jgi:hypothetical protein
VCSNLSSLELYAVAPQAFNSFPVSVCSEVPRNAVIVQIGCDVLGSRFCAAMGQSPRIIQKTNHDIDIGPAYFGLFLITHQTSGNDLELPFVQDLCR